MIHQRYFKNGQRILLTLQKQEDDGRKEYLTAILSGGDDHGFIVSLPYSEDAAQQYPFSKGMQFEIICGLRLKELFPEERYGNLWMTIASGAGR